MTVRDFLASLIFTENTDLQYVTISIYTTKCIEEELQNRNNLLHAGAAGAFNQDSGTEERMS